MKSKSFAFFTVFLLLCLAGGATVFYFRLTLLNLTLNRLISSQQLEIERIDELSVDSHHLTIKQITLLSGEEKLPQSLSDLSISYSLANWQVETVTIDRAKLTVSSKSEERDNKNITEPSSIKDLLTTLATLPLKQLEIGQLEINALAPPIEVIWQRENTAQSLHLKQYRNTLSINMDTSQANHWHANVAIHYNNLQATDMQMSLMLGETSHQLAITTKLNIESLAGLMNQYAQLPDYSRTASGLVQLDISAVIPDNYVTGLTLSEATVHLLKSDVVLDDKTMPLKLGINGAPSLQLYFLENSTMPSSLMAKTIPLILESPDQSQQASIEISALQCSWQPELLCELSYQAALNLVDISRGQYRGVDINAKLEGNADLSSSQISLAVNPGRLFSSSEIFFDDIKVNKAVLVTSSELKANYTFDSETLFLSIDQFDLLIPRINRDNVNLSTQFSIKTFEATVGKSTDATLRLGSNSINLQIDKQWLPALAIDSKITLRDNTLSVNGQIFGDRKKQLASVDGKHHLANNNGHADISIDQIHFDSGGSKLSSWFSSWPYQADLQGGKASLQAQLAWSLQQGQWNLTGTTNQSLDKLSGYLGSVPFIGLDLQHSLMIYSLNHWVSSKPGAVKLSMLDIGVPITDIAFQLVYDSNQQALGFSNITSHIFGGTVSSSDFTYRDTEEDNIAMLTLSDIHIEKIVTLAGYEDIQASGVIDGTLPLLIGSRGVSIDAGQLSAQAPGGVIRYLPASNGAVASDNPTMRVVNEALQYYQYDSMLAGVHYSKAGDLNLRIKMKGQNPELNKGQRINLNLNIEDNIPMLLKSLQSGRAIADVLSRKALR